MKNIFTPKLSIIKGIQQFSLLAILLVCSQSAFGTESNNSTLDVVSTSEMVSDIVCRQPTSTCSIIGECGRNADDLIVLGPFVVGGATIVSLTNDAPDYYPNGTTPVVWTAVNSAGVMSTCTSLVIINDEEAPVIECPGNIVKYLAPTQCNTSFVLDADVLDNCGSSLVTINGSTPLPVTMNLSSGLYPTEITATDAAGNSSTCIANIAVHDVTTPELVSCPNNVSVVGLFGETATSANLPVPVITDACGVHLTSDAPELFTIGETTTVNWKGMDDYGNWVMCTYTVTAFPFGTLPVEWLSFSATAQKNEVLLDWATTEETDNAGFEVERRSEDERDFTYIGKVDATTILSDINNYSFVDTDVKMGVNYYYRIRQYDFDHSSSLSEIESVKIENRDNDFSVYPNPVTDVVTLAIGDLRTGYVTATLIDHLGRTLEVRDYEGIGNERLQFNVSDYASGLLIFVLTQDGKVINTQRIIKK